MYGWDPKKEKKTEALQKLIGYITKKHRRGQRDFLHKCYELISERREHEIGKLADLQPHDKNYLYPEDTIGKIRDATIRSLEEYYETEEGKASRYIMEFDDYLHLSIKDKKRERKKAIALQVNI